MQLTPSYLQIEFIDLLGFACKPFSLCSTSALLHAQCSICLPCSFFLHFLLFFPLLFLLATFCFATLLHARLAQVQKNL
ncbi:MAG: hypothetical protein CMR00_06065 [[Chlorobium] sp. 445]|nr:MAG: hypothetical protein CMR00_06065 [[Chlorobium] sp. 445]